MPGARAVLKLLRGQLLLVTGLGFVASLAMLASPCCVGLLLFPIVLGQLVALLLGDRRGEEAAMRGWLLVNKLVLAAGPLVLVTAALFGAGLAEPLIDSFAPSAQEQPWLRGLLDVFALLLGPAIAGAASAPLLLLPYALRDSPTARPFPETLFAAVELGTRQRFGAVLLGSAIAGMLFVLPAVLSYVIGVGWLLLLQIPLLPLLLAWPAALYLERRDAPNPPGEPLAAPALPRAALGLGFVALLLSIAIAAPLLLAMTRPSAPRELSPIRDRVPHGVPLPATLPGSEVRISAHEAGGVRVEAPDGGGAGLVPLPNACTEVVFVALPRGEGHRLLLECEDWYRLELSPDGVRLDDGPSRRISSRLGLFGSFLLLLALGIWALVVIGALPTLARARSLARFRLEDRADSAVSGLRVLEGQLEGDGVLFAPSARQLEVDGELWLVNADVRLRIPSGRHRALLPSRTDSVEDLGPPARLSVIARFPRLVSAGLREASLPWPDEARLVPGGLEESAALLMRGASRRAVMLLALLLPILILELFILAS